MKFRAVINEIENKKTIKENFETKICLSEQINKIHKALARLSKKKREERRALLLTLQK